MYKERKTAVIIAAAGSGRRMGGGINKQYINIAGMPVLARSVLVFEENPHIHEIVLVVRPGEEDLCRRKIVEPYGFKKVSAVIGGGAQRQDSVHAALKILSSDVELVLIHDGARPLVSQQVVEQVVAAAAQYGAAVPAIPVKDTIKTVASAGDSGAVVTGTPVRSTLRAVQTPQGFHRDILEQAFQACKDTSSITDDSSLVEALGIPVRVTEGEERNLKITTPEDVERAEQLLKRSGAPLPLTGIPRTGTGFDVHAFAPDRKLILGGVEIPHTQGLLGHSDADVLLHAVMDALLGAACLGDIGKHFPDSDPAYKGISSLLLLEHTGRLLQEHRWTIVNIDATVIAQRPKIAPYIGQMKKNMAQVLKISESQINIKGTTTERLGFTGREEGIAAQGAVSIVQF